MPIATDEILKQPDSLLTNADEGEMFFEFDSDGFLTERRSTLGSGINAAHNGLLARAQQINKDCHELLFAAEIHNRDSEEILCATVFTRALEHYQATLILLGIGLIAPAKVTLRATIESVSPHAQSPPTRMPGGPSSTMIFSATEADPKSAAI